MVNDLTYDELIDLMVIVSADISLMRDRLDHFSTEYHIHLAESQQRLERDLYLYSRLENLARNQL